MKLKHNKKRNTAFLYEALIKEYTKAVLHKENQKKNKIISILKEFFSSGKLLRKDLENYKTLLETKISDPEVSTRLVMEVKKDYHSLDRKAVFNLQTKLIKTINESVSNKVFANFISNYKDIATIGQFFANDGNAKQRIILEDRVAKLMKPQKESKKDFLHVDNLTYNTFVKKFNESYEHTLRTEQKNLLTCYITSFADNGLGLKVFMNEEVGRLKSVIKECKQNHKHEDKLNAVLNKLDNLSKTPISESVVRDIFYIQDLMYEVTKK